MDELNQIFIALLVILILLYAGYIIGEGHTNGVINSPELRQCLSQSGTTWQGGECVIILNK